MSKAEEAALKVYPQKIEGDSRGSYDLNELSRQKFLLGYHQAEKDLLENKHEKSWRLDEKLWKGIKDIEEASYQYMYDASNDWAYDIPTWEDVQDAFKAGSEWKEGLELTWEDIRDICSIQYIVLNEYGDYDEPTSRTLYQEVLKRFKASKIK